VLNGFVAQRSVADAPELAKRVEISTGWRHPRVAFGDYEGPWEDGPNRPDNKATFY
jgi:hypothetical protein